MMNMRLLDLIISNACYSLSDKLVSSYEDFVRHQMIPKLQKFVADNPPTLTFSEAIKFLKPGQAGSIERQEITNKYCFSLNDYVRKECQNWAKTFGEICSPEIAAFEESLKNEIGEHNYSKLVAERWSISHMQSPPLFYRPLVDTVIVEAAIRMKLVSGISWNSAFEKCELYKSITETLLKHTSEMKKNIHYEFNRTKEFVHRVCDI